MFKNSNIWALTGDLGFGGFDKIKKDFPDRFINFQAAEFGMMGTACGLAVDGKIPVVYSITTFLIFRPMEILRTYINYENIPVKLVASGRDKDYLHDGISHWTHDIKPHLDLFTNIKQYWPQSKEEITEDYLDEFLNNEKPCFLSLKR